MNKKNFNIIGQIEYTGFPLVEYMWKEIVIDDIYGLKKIRERYGDKIKSILDIGGNLGIFSVYARELFPNARIISLEALYDTFISLQANTKIYNIESYNIALGDGSTLFLKKCLEHSGANQFIKNNTNNISIKSMTLQHIFKNLNIEEPYIIKMDIEGSEMFLYQDNTCIDILKNCLYFTMEYHDVNMLGFYVHKPNWDRFLQNIFENFDIEGLGGKESGAIYRITK